MRVISRKKLREFWADHPEAEAPLQQWYLTAKHADWENFGSVRATYGSADQVNQFVVFNVGGNKFRVIAFIDYERRKLFVRQPLTHEEYDKGKWKEDTFGKAKSKGRSPSSSQPGRRSERGQKRQPKRRR
jgi:mRNA interferase HigB